MRQRRSAFVLDPNRLPIEDRMVSFTNKPSEDELGIAIGYPLMGSSSTTVVESKGQVQVIPQRIPITLCTIWMYFVIMVMAVTTCCLGNLDEVKVPLFVLGFAAVMIVPIMMGMLAWINRQQGTAPYLIYDSANETLTLPRLEISFPSKQIEMLVSVDRFINNDRFFQIAVLIRRDNDWLYAHVCNESSGSVKLVGWQFKSLTRMIADSIEAKFIALQFNRAQSKELSLAKKTGN